MIVRNAHELTSGLSWEPMVLWRAFRDVSNKKGSSNVNVRAIDCLDLCEVSCFDLLFALMIIIKHTCSK